MAANPKRPAPTSRDDFQIAILCALEEERDTVEALMDSDPNEERQLLGKVRNDDNVYTYGKLGGKPVVLVTASRMGTTTMKDVASCLHMSFVNIMYAKYPCRPVKLLTSPSLCWELRDAHKLTLTRRYAFLVGITGGAPFRHAAGTWQDSDIHLGDVLVSTHVIEYDFGRVYENSFSRRRGREYELPRAPPEVVNFIKQLETRKSPAFNRILTKTNVELADHKTLGRNDDYAHPGAEKDLVFASKHRHKHQFPGICATCDQCTAW
ncbi:hypothetical protein LTR10_010582 [Elasticomyces elasticus]|nr:hypothetical protein LTR10_010582 [Elasticomyces elasticus]KAK4972480.1 hypothetical protein LTR42_006990 [Elasticomyces elasticus]